MRRLATSVAFAVFAAALSLLGGPFCVCAQPINDTSLAKARARNLRHGINLSHWFAQVFDPKGYTKEHFEAWTTPQDIALIKSIGFDHVRFTLNPQPMFRGSEAEQIPAEYLGYVDAAVKTILDNNLAIVIDIHPESDFKQKLSGDEFVEQFADFWRALARHFAASNPDKVFFEILNEPEIHDRYRWNGIQAHLAAAVREGAPQHTILVEGARWASSDELLFLDPIRDPNVIYNFHDYEPGIFTHQGATWAESYWHEIRELPYPSTSENVQEAMKAVPDAIHKMQVARYGMDQWNASRIDAELSQIEAWAKRWNVPVVCNEFGVYRKAAKAEDRARWISDMRALLEKHGFGWTMWDYAGGFGVAIKKDGETTVDENTVKALGLHMPPAK